MTDAEWKVLGEYLRWCANELGLRDWEFVLKRDPPGESRAAKEDETVLAQILCTYGRKYATVRVCEDFRSRDPEEQRWVILHELIHCHLEPISEVIRCELFGMERLTASEYSAVKSSYRRANEFAVDGLAHSVAKFFPLIKWPVRK